MSGSEEFSSFPEDLVAEQLTYMDAVSITCASERHSEMCAVEKAQIPAGLIPG